MAVGCPTVSVIIPCFNHERFVGQAIESVLGQRGVDFEVLVIDDGSTDGSARVIARYAGWARVRSVRQDNRGLSAARNVGLRRSRGRYLKFLDADDWLLPGILAVQATRLDDLPEVGVLFGGWRVTDERGRVLSERTRGDGPLDSGELLVRNHGPVHAGLFRREWVERLGGFDESLRAAEDWDLHGRLYLAGCRFHTHPAVGCAYRLVGGSMSHQARNQYEMSRRVLDRLHGQAGLPSARRAEALEHLMAVCLKRAYAAGDGALALELAAGLAGLRPDRWADTGYLLRYLADVPYLRWGDPVYAATIQACPPPPLRAVPGLVRELAWQAKRAACGAMWRRGQRVPAVMCAMWAAVRHPGRLLAPRRGWLERPGGGGP